MRKTPYVLLVCLLLLFVQHAFSQAICGFDAIHARKMKEDPAYRKQVLASEATIREYIRLHPLPAIPKRSPASNTIIQGSKANPVTLGGSPLYTIPVVIHVVHTGGAVGTIYNPTDAQIIGAIDYLNAVYNGSYPGIQGAGDLQIQFVLAQRDPNCNPTNGINRVDGSGIANYATGGVNSNHTVGPGTDDLNVKNFIRWDPTRYYNIWIVDKIDGNDGTSGTFVAGFAYFPGSGPSLDGTVMLATQMITGQKTLPHEIGHAFNLYHPFEGSADSTHCQPSTNCSMTGDQICDTDPMSFHSSAAGGVNFKCRTGQPNPCTGGVYTINTESNFMNYTNCYTLFTADQKARMLASAASTDRSSLSTSLGGLAPNAGGSPCSPKIDFELSGDHVTEATTTTAGCRSFTDHNYNMVIGNTPSATATATISAGSGNAVQGVDFDITTNGSFSSPSQTLTFPAGFTAAQPFTIRVYDDANVNGARNRVLGFSVNSGGGNAVAGNGRTSFNMIMDDNDLAPVGPHAVTASLGTFANFILPGPLDASQTRNKAQFIYYASELTAAGVKAGNITSLALNIVKNSAANFIFHGVTIKMGLVAQTTLFNGSFVNESGFTTVFNSDYTPVNGWNTFTLSTPFAWNGTSSVVVQFCYDNGAATSAADACEEYDDGTGTTNYTYLFQNGNSCTNFTAATPYQGNKPLIRFTYADPGNSIQMVLNSSGQEYLGPNTDVYFYDQSTHKLMARIHNLSAFDYGCTQVVIDRAGMASTPFWNNNTANYLMDKTFHVLPTTNNPSGNYDITLFYTQAEIDGWHLATGQNLSDIQLVKTTNPISAVTPADPTGGGTVTVGAPAISTLGTNTGLTYSFTNGFSGFGAGVPGISILPVGLLDFEGQIRDHNAFLSWSTSFEAGSKGFGIERSYDGNVYTTIGFVPSAGNSATRQDYSFKDPAIAQDLSYYRLKETDLDDQFKYSKILLLKDPSASVRSFTVLSNPFTDNLDIAFGRAPVGRVQLRLLDITGKELLRQAGTETGLGRMRVDLSGRHLSPGVYLLEVGFNGGIYTEKVIKR